MEKLALLPDLAHWQDVNFPPGKEELAKYFKQGICPHFELLCQGAMIIGQTREDLVADRTFCGKWMAFGPHTEIPSGPNTACARIAKKLGEMIQEAEPAVKRPIQPLKDGKVRVTISCKPEELDGKLHGYLDRSRGAKALEKLRAGVVALEGEAAREKTPKEILRSAQNVFRAMCRKTLGVKDVRGLIIFLMSSFHDEKKGCKQQPENIKPFYRED